MNKNIILYADSIEKSFPGTKALKGVTIELERGEVHAIVGENGAGKSTLMNVISGVYQADSGEITLDGKVVTLKKIRTMPKRQESGWCTRSWRCALTCRWPRTCTSEGYPRKAGLWRRKGCMR